MNRKSQQTGLKMQNIGKAKTYVMPDKTGIQQNFTWMPPRFAAGMTKANVMPAKAGIQRCVSIHQKSPLDATSLRGWHVICHPRECGDPFSIDSRPCGNDMATWGREQSQKIPIMKIQL
jgi:hypothetical protein